MRADCAAAYLSVSRSTFLQWVDDGIMPKPIRPPGGGVTLWDRLALDVAFEALAATEEDERNSFDKITSAIKQR
jgi:predicted DNA-binding transcriptional regulator AlpA